MTHTPFGAVEALPPTPPKEKTLNDTLDSFIEYLDSDPLDLPQSNVQFLHTPPPSSSPLSKSSLQKKIRFVTEPAFSDELDQDDSSHTRPVPLRQIPPSKYQKSRRSILKRALSDDVQHLVQAGSQEDDPPSSEDTPSKPQTPIDMLESAVKQLASDDYAARIDSYMMLNRTFKAYKNEPNRQALVAQIPRFEAFLKRDLSAKSPVTNGLDGKMISQVLKIIANFFLDQSLHKRISQDFVNMLYETFSQSMDDPHVPKEIMKHQLYMFTVDKFLSRGINNARAVKILDYLSIAHERVSGKSVQILRLQIIQKFHTYATQALTGRPNAWIPCLVQAMSVEYLRDLAIHVAAMCANAFGRVKNVTAALRTFFDTKTEGDKSNFEHLYADLLAKIDARQDILYIPRLCAIVIMFMRGPQNRIEEWSRLTEWLRLFQICLNSSDAALGIQAITAWNYMIFASSPSKATSAKLLHALPQPFVHIMRRRASKDSKEFQLRTAALGTYCYLLNNAFRPPNSLEQFDLFWSQYVVDVLANVKIHYESDLETVSRIFSSLMRKSQLTVWDANRYETTFENVVVPEEVPRLEPVWIRRNAASAVRVIEHLLKCQVSLGLETDYVAGVFDDFLWAIGEAGKRDIKVSSDLKKVLIELLHACQRVSGSAAVARRPASALKTLLRITVSIRRHLGSSKLTEELINRDGGGQLDFAKSPTPLRLQNVGELESLSSLLIAILASFRRVMKLDEEMRNVLDNLILDSIKSSNTIKQKLQVLRRFARTQQPGGHHAPWLWRSVARVLTGLLSAIKGPAEVRDIHHYVQHILRAGLDIEDSDVYYDYRILIGAWMQAVKTIIGDAGVILAVVKPLIEATTNSDSTRRCWAGLGCATTILELSISVPNEKMLEAAKRLLWQDEALAVNSDVETMFVPLCSLINEVLCASFARPVCEGGKVDDLIRALQHQSNTSLIVSWRDFLRLSEEGLCAFARFASTTSGKELFIATWRKVLMRTSCSIAQDKSQIFLHRKLLIAGLTSYDIAIANATIEWWNEEYGKEENIDYPVDVQEVLAKLQQVAFVELRSKSFTRWNASQSSLEAGKDDLSVLFPWVKNIDPERDDSGIAVKEGAIPQPLRFGKSPSRLITSNADSSRPSAKIPAPSKRTTPAKLRHDDSQIEFVPIASSPTRQESQLLTEHQKEVRDRQIENASSLRRFDSSPVPRRFMHASAHAPESLSKDTKRPQSFVSDHEHESEDDRSLGDPYDIPDSPPCQDMRGLPRAVPMADAPQKDETRDDAEKVDETIFDTLDVTEPLRSEEAAERSTSRSATSMLELGQHHSENPLSAENIDLANRLAATSSTEICSTDVSSNEIEHPPQTRAQAPFDEELRHNIDVPQSEKIDEIDGLTGNVGHSPEGSPALENGGNLTSVGRRTRKKSAKAVDIQIHRNMAGKKPGPVSATTQNSRKRPSEGPDEHSAKHAKLNVTAAPTTMSNPRELCLGFEESTTRFKELYNITKRKIREDKGLTLEFRKSKRKATKQTSQASTTQTFPISSQRRSQRTATELQHTTVSQKSQTPLPSSSQRSTRKSHDPRGLLTVDDLPLTSRKRRSQPQAHSIGDSQEMVQKSKRLRVSRDSHDERQENAVSTTSAAQSAIEHVRLDNLEALGGDVDSPSEQAREDAVIRSRTTRQKLRDEEIPSTPKRAQAEENPHTPQHSTPPSSQSFTLSLSERAQRVIKTLQEAYTAAQQLIWPRNQEQADTIEDLQFELQSELRRARRAGRQRSSRA